MAVTIDQTIATLLQRAARERATRDVHAATVRARVAEFARSRLPAGTTAWLIGSLAWGGFGERSDVDIVLRGGSSEQACRFEVELTRELQLEVDILHFEDLPTTFRERIVQQGLRLNGA